MTVAYLSLGSNLGDRVDYLSRAVRRVDSGGVRLRRVSSVYETAPQGITDQPAFLNMAVEVETQEGPEALLAHIQAAEQAMGRVRAVRWGPRTLDIDILLFGEVVMRAPGLELPHPRMLDRAFVLVPLLDLNPGLVHPGTGRRLQAHLEALPDQGIGLFLRADSFLQRVRGVQ